jgi:hypothetical protein
MFFPLFIRETNGLEKNRSLHVHEGLTLIDLRNTAYQVEKQRQNDSLNLKYRGNDRNASN